MDGTVVSDLRVDYSGAFLVTEKSIFFKSAFGLVEYDHERLEETDRIEYRAEVEPLYEGEPPTVNAFWLSEESVIWTTMHGVLMGVSRKPGRNGKRQTWCERVPNALMPIAEPPIGHGEYLYFTRKGETWSSTRTRAPAEPSLPDEEARLRYAEGSRGQSASIWGYSGST